MIPVLERLDGFLLWTSRSFCGFLLYCVVGNVFHVLELVGYGILVQGLGKCLIIGFFVSNALAPALLNNSDISINICFLLNP